MATPRRAKDPFVERLRRAERGETRLTELVADMVKEPCPQCGNRSLVYEGGTANRALRIFCERAFCGWK